MNIRIFARGKQFSLPFCSFKHKAQTPGDGITWLISYCTANLYPVYAALLKSPAAEEVDGMCHNPLATISRQQPITDFRTVIGAVRKMKSDQSA